MHFIKYFFFKKFSTYNDYLIGNIVKCRLRDVDDVLEEQSLVVRTVNVSPMEEVQTEFVS